MNLLSKTRSSCILHFKKLYSMKFTPRGFHSRIKSYNLQPKPQSDQTGGVGKSLLKCVMFSAGFTGLMYSESVIRQYRSSKNESIFGRENFAAFFNKDLGRKAGGVRGEINDWWNSLSVGQKVFWPILFMNVSVFACWKVARLQPLMLKYFTSSPYQKAVCMPMLLSCFSHYNLWHIGANMYVLHSFSTPMGALMGSDDFIAYYMSAGVLTSLGSSIIKAISRSTVPSLGASGAIMALLGYFCSRNPNAELGIIFVPHFRFSAENALYALVAFDLAGIIFKFKLFDHGAHLAGALLGIVYANYVEDRWIRYKIKIFKDLKAIDEFRR